MPPGFRYVDDTARLDGITVTIVQDGRELSLIDIDFDANETKKLELMLVVGAGVSHGQYINQAFVLDPAGQEVSARAEAIVRVTPDPLFDCSELIGKVFDDKNQNGYQDENEPGLAGVRLATAKGLLVTTDQHGRYHIACAAIPNGKIGSNFIIKLDPRSLPTGYRITTENPRVVRLTRGKMSKANFGAAIQRIVTLDMTDAAFEGESVNLRSDWESQLDGLVKELSKAESILRINYHTVSAGGSGAKPRLDQVTDLIRSKWDRTGCCYRLNIEKKTISPEDVNPLRVAGQE